MIELFNTVSDEYNKTPLATEHGFPFGKSNYEFLQLKKVVAHVTAESVFLDIGTGCGIVPRAVKKLGARAISVDWPVTGGTAAIENVKLAGVEGYYCEVGRDPIPLEDNSVDCVLFADVIEHLHNSPKPVLAEIHRLLKPNGVCLATTPNSTRLTVRLKIIAGYSNWPNINDFYDLEYHNGHHHEYTVEEFRDVFIRSGFTISEFTLYEEVLRTTKVSNFSEIHSHNRDKDMGGKKDHPIVSLAKPFLILLTNLFPRLRSRMLLVARKI